jgi:hypothetical protein
LQLQLLNLPLQLLRSPSELHPPQLRDQHFQPINLGLPRGQQFLFRLKCFLLCGQLFVLRQDQCS